MSAQIRYSKIARQDIDATVDWFDAALPGLGDTFLLHLDAVLQLITRHPEIGSPQGHGTRRRLIRRFPYSVFYRLRGGTIEVLGVLPQAIDPAITDERLESLDMPVSSSAP